MKRLWLYLEGRKLVAVGLVLVATGNAAAQTGGWLLVRDAIDKGIRAGNEHHLTVIVVIYLIVAACGWLLQAVLIRGLAGLGQRMVLGLRQDLFDHLTGLSLRYFSQQKAGLDHRAADERRRRGLGRPLAGHADARRKRDPAARRGDRAADRGLAARPRRARDGAVRAHLDALVPAHLARRADRDAQPHRRRHGADRGVRLRNGGRAGLQPGAHLPGAVRRAERGEPRAEHLHAEDLLDLLPVDRVPRGARNRRRPLHGQLAAHASHDHDRDADHRSLPAPARLPAAAGALGCVRPAAVGRCRDGQDRDGPRRGAGHPGPAPPARAAADRGRSRDRPGRLRVRRGAGAARRRDPRAAGRLSRTRRRVRGRQVHARAPRRALLRPGSRRGARRRCRSARGEVALVPPPARRRPAGSVPLQRHDRLEHPLREAWMRPTRRSPQQPPRSASTSSRPGSRAASSTPCARAAPACRRASAS